METDIKSVTPSGLSYIIDRLGKGEALRIARAGDGRAKVSIVKGKREISKLDNMLFTALNPEPVAPGWMSVHDEYTPHNKKIRHEHRVRLNRSAKKSRNRKDLLTGIFLLELAFKDISEAYLVKRHMSAYYVFSLGKYVVYTDEKKSPKMYSEGERGELIFL